MVVTPLNVVKKQKTYFCESLFIIIEFVAINWYKKSVKCDEAIFQKR